MGEPIPSDGQEETVRQQLFQLAMRGKWKDVVSLCKNNPDFIGRPLTRTEDTTLHVAISAGDEDWVIQLLDVLKIIQQEETKVKKGGMNGILTKKNDDGPTPMVRKILEMQNEGGSTPMHLAAALGMERACWEMAMLCPDLVTMVRNKNGETPLFTAVRHGKKEAFFALEHGVQKLENKESLGQTPPPEKKKRDVTHCRRDKDGNNILHCAIFGEYFDLAYEIIHLYPELVNYVSMKGESPLHYLANKPSCFRSGIRFGFFDTVIYYCIIIGPLRRKFKTNKDHKSDKLTECASEDPILPATWDTFSLIFTFIKSIFYINVVDPRKNEEDEENKNDEKDEEDNKLPFPEIYEVGVALFKLVMKVLMVILGIGLRRTQTLERKKRKITYAYQLMNELVECSKAWNYVKNERDPRGGMGTHLRFLDPNRPPPDEISSTNTCLPTQHSSSSTSTGIITSHPNNSSNFSVSRVENGEQHFNAHQRLNCGSLDYIKLYATEMWKQEGHWICINNCAGGNFKPDKTTAPGILPKKGKIIYEVIDVPEEDASNEPNKVIMESLVLTAAKNGIIEIVEKILDIFPVAAWDIDKDEKNIVLLAVEYRQSHVYESLVKRKIIKDPEFRRVDKNGNSALHLVAKPPQGILWSLPGAVPQLQREIQWFKRVLHLMDVEFFATYNNEGKTAQQVFTEAHKGLVEEAGKWMSRTSNSCSVIAALVAGVSFNSVATVPGGPNQISGVPILFDKSPFQVFAFSSLLSFCFSVFSLVMFLTIISSRYREQDFEWDLPAKLIIGLSSLFTAIVALLVSFGAGNLFVVDMELNYVAFAIYALFFFLAFLFAIRHFFPFGVELFQALLAPAQN